MMMRFYKANTGPKKLRLLYDSRRGEARQAEEVEEENRIDMTNKQHHQQQQQQLRYNTTTCP